MALFRLVDFEVVMDSYGKISFDLSCGLLALAVSETSPLKSIVSVEKTLAAKLNVRRDKARKILPQMIDPCTGNAVLTTDPGGRRTFAR